MAVMEEVLAEEEAELLREDLVKVLTVVPVPAEGLQNMARRQKGRRRILRARTAPLAEALAI